MKRKPLPVKMFTLTLTQEERWLLAHGLYSDISDTQNPRAKEVLLPILRKLGGEEYLKRPSLELRYICRHGEFLNPCKDCRGTFYNSAQPIPEVKP